jgi:predicted ester cyclase
MSSIRSTAERFFEACETGKGWEVCSQYCHADATFSAQSDALADVTTLQAYTDWMGGITALMPDARYDLKFFGVDGAGESVCAYAVFHGTHTVEGGPVPPTGKSTASDYVYHMQFGGDRIRHMTKIWNDAFAMKELGWA